MQSVAGLDFTGYESGVYRIFGRPFKMGRCEVVAVLLALENWLNEDHDARWRSYAERVRMIHESVPDVQGVRAQAAFFTMDERLEDDPINCLALHFSKDAKLSADLVAERLSDGMPSIASIPLNDKLIVAVDAMTDGHAQTIAARLPCALR